MEIKDLLNLGFREGPIIEQLLKAIDLAKTSNMAKTEILYHVARLHDQPARFMSHPYFGEAAQTWNIILHTKEE